MLLRSQSPLRQRTAPVALLLLLFLLSGLAPIPASSAQPEPPHRMYLPDVAHFRSPWPVAGLSWMWADVADAPGLNGITVADWDGDGHNEVFTAQSATVAALRHTGSYRFEQVWAARIGGGWGLQDLNDDGTQELWTVYADGQVVLFAPFAFAPKPVGRVPGQVQWAEISDLMGDGRTLLLTRNGAGLLHAYTWPDLAPVWTQRSGACTLDPTAPRLMTLQGDDDPQREIVLSCGSVIDPVQNAEQWRYDAGFGAEIDAADLDGDGREELVATKESRSATAFDVESRTSAWEISGFDPKSVLLADVAGDAALEILLGSSGSGAIQVYDGSTRQPLSSFTGPYPGVHRLGAGDVNDDGQPDLIWGVGYWSPGPDHLYLAPVSHLDGAFAFPDYDGPFHTLPMQLDADPGLELVIITGSTNDYDNGPTHFVLDGVTGRPEPALKIEVAGLDGSWSGRAAPSTLLANADDDPYDELFLASFGWLYFLDHDGRRMTRRLVRPVVPVPDWVGDADGDGALELVAHDNQQVGVYTLPGLDVEWQTEALSQGVNALAVADVDGDGHFEAVFHGPRSYLQAYDLQTHRLDWQMPASQSVDGLAIGNADVAGDLELVVVEDRLLTFYNARTRERLRQTARIDDGSYPYVGENVRIAFAHLTGDAFPQLLVYAGDVRVFRDPFQTLPSQRFGSLVAGMYGGDATLEIADVDGDRHLDLLEGNFQGVVRWRMQDASTDVTPPQARPILPRPGWDMVGRNAHAEAGFSESMDPATVTPANAQLQYDGAPVAATLAYDDARRVLRLTPQDLLPANSAITVWLGPGLCDRAGHGLDGNFNGIGGEPDDAFTWRFVTGSGTDTVGPRVEGLTLSPNVAWQNMLVTLSATLDDREPAAASIVEAAEYFAGSLGEPGTGIPLPAVDGVFDGRQEAVQVSLDTTGWAGQRTFYVRGRDSLGNWGTPVSATLNMVPEQPGNWPTFGHDPAHTGYSPAQAGIAGYSLSWQKDLAAILSVQSNNPPKQITVADGLVLAQVDAFWGNGGIMALDAATGAERWRKAFSNKYSVNPATIAYGNVYFQQGNHGDDSYLFAVDALTGAELWKSPFGTQWTSYYHPTVAAGKVLINAGVTGGAYAYDAASGTELWWRDLEQFDEWTPTYSGRLVYTFTYGNFRALDANSGVPLWSLALGWEFQEYSMRRVVAVAGDTAYLTSTTHGGDLIAVDLLQRKEKWRVSGSFTGTPAVADGQVYALGGTWLKVLDAATGALAWSYDTGATLAGAPLVTAGDVYVASPDHTWVISRSTHQPVWQIARGGWLTVANDQLFIAQPDGKLVAFDAIRATHPVTAAQAPAPPTEAPSQQADTASPAAEPTPDHPTRPLPAPPTPAGH